MGPMCRGTVAYMLSDQAKEEDMGSIMRFDGEKDTLSIAEEMSFQCDSNCFWFLEAELVILWIQFRLWLYPPQMLHISRVICRAVLLTKPKCLYFREILCRWVSSYFEQTETGVVGFTEWHPWSCLLKFSHTTLEGFFWSAMWYINIPK